MLPIDFEKRMQNMLLDEYPAFAETFRKREYKALRFNLNKTIIKENQTIESLISQIPFPLEPIPWEPSGFYYDEDQVRPGKHAYHEAGVYYIQEPSAMAPAAFLGVTHGDFVLDLCAAPGGKSSQIASYLNQTGLLISNEIHPQRAKILSENMERMGLRNCIVTNESPDRLSSVFPDFFDKIMVDAPCSGEGMFRKNDDACGEWSLDHVTLCANRQDHILDEAAAMLRPGGRMVYSTCTFAPSENEGSIARFLQRHNDFSIESSPLIDGMEHGRIEWLQESEKEGLSTTQIESIQNTIRLWPHKIHGEGHFVAILRKEGEPERKIIPVSTHGRYQAKKGKSQDYSPLYDFLQNEEISLSVNESSLLFFGDQLYLMPENAPSLDKLKVLRPGLHLGTLKKNRFEPSHALALTLNPSECKHIFPLSQADDRVLSYLGGNTFPCDGEKGWYLICVDNFSLGWGKCAGGIMKNHYPKGLRK